MTSRQVVLSKDAEDDLDKIEAYIVEQSGELRAADVRSRLEKTMSNLAFMPGIGRERPYLDVGARAFPAPPWTIVYDPLPGGDGILVQRVLHGRRDLAAIFKKPQRRRR
ncbi:MAG TPA: type II toxin-antitoxin system RelE/ParE family toxin [Rhizomicrobium sp.]|nr:type II toxin-antitoxin system RelE/ParE family toxin [Rhizomicrobium sp.]